jgi:hypothetical protein
MFKVGALELPLELIAKSKTVIVNGAAPWYDYADGKRTDRLLGYGYDCVLPRNGYQALRIKVESEAAPSITSEMLTAAGGSIEAEPINFVCKVYVDSSGRANLSAKATGVVPVKKA